MCGIIGYVGKNNCTEYILDGLKHLQYRGYDSSGIAIFNSEDNIKILKKCGKINDLINCIKSSLPLKGLCGIGHTRWATHGQPNDVNAHPHKQNNVTLVHNGIIENYEELKELLKNKGYKFKTQTDTEVLAAIIDYFYANSASDPIKAIKKAAKTLNGSYAVGIMFKNIKNTIYATRKDSPLLIGIGNGEYFLASDITAFIKHTNKYIVLEQGEIAILKKDNVKIVDFNGNNILKNTLTANWDIHAAEKNGFPHFMLKEIFEQPESIKNCINSRVTDNNITLEIENINDKTLKSFSKIYIVACGTAMHAGLVGKYIIEKLARIPVTVEIASEFRYKNPILKKNNLVIVISQSGETADSLASLELAKKNKIFTLAIVNVVGSSIARLADSVIYTWAGPEISVASTKAFSVQMAALYMLALKLCKLKNTVEYDISKYCKALKQVPYVAENMLKLNDKILDIAKLFYKSQNMFFIGRGIDYYLALESSLKLKEISYIHSEAYAAGELKHGSIALIENNTPVVAIATQENLYAKTISNAKEALARGAKLFLICNEENKIDKSLTNIIIKIPKTLDIFTPFYAIIPMQLFAYHVANLKGCNVDEPRNLAKSVTVE